MILFCLALLSVFVLLSATEPFNPRNSRNIRELNSKY